MNTITAVSLHNRRKPKIDVNKKKNKNSVYEKWAETEEYLIL